MANINDGLSTYHLSTGTHRVYQPAKGNFFEFIIEDFGDLLKAGVDKDLAEESDYIQNGQEIIRLTVNKMSSPQFELGDLEIRKGNSVVHYAGVPTFSDGTIEVDDMVGCDAKTVLEAWRGLAYDVVTDKGGRAINYKKNCTLIEYTSDHVKVRSWKMIGCWIKAISEDDYDKTNDDIRRVSATIRCDRALPEVE